MIRKSFWIPVGWSPGWSPDRHILLHSHTLVLTVPNGVLQDPFEVERVPGSWSPHIPEKHPVYRVAWGRKRSSTTLTLSPVRLGTVGIGHSILVPLMTSRPQTCLNINGQLHGIYMNLGGTHPRTNCGESKYLSITEMASYYVKGEPTCPACLTYKAVWCLFSVLPYDDKREVTKRARKEKTAEEKRLRLPTAYARILDDDLFENPTYKPPKQRVVPIIDVDLDEDYADDPRARKRASAIDRSRRFETAKARAQGHRR